MINNHTNVLAILRSVNGVQKIVQRPFFNNRLLDYAFLPRFLDIPHRPFVNRFLGLFFSLMLFVDIVTLHLVLVVTSFAGSTF